MELYLRLMVIISLFWLFSESTIAQELWDVEGDSTIKIENPPSDLQNWTPKDSMFQFYINTDNNHDNSLRFSILNGSSTHPFQIRYVSDTVFIYVLPPNYELTEESRLDSLPDTVSLVICAGTKRSVYKYCYNYDTNKPEIKELVPTSFIQMTPVKTLDSMMVYLYSPGKNGHAEKIKNAIKNLKGIAELKQLKSGYYEGIWHYVSDEKIRKNKVNWVGKNTKDTGALIFFELDDAKYRQKAESILSKILNPDK